MPAKGVVLLQRGVICREEMVLWVGNYVGDSVYSIEGYFYTPPVLKLEHALKFQNRCEL